MCLEGPLNADRGARIIARRLNLWFTDIPIDELAPMVRRMIENNWEELAAAAHAIHNEDRGVKTP